MISFLYLRLFEMINSLQGQRMKIDYSKITLDFSFKGEITIENNIDLTHIPHHSWFR